MQGAPRDRFDDGLSRNARTDRARAYEAIPMPFACAVQSSGRPIRSAKASAVSSGGWSPAGPERRGCGIRLGTATDLSVGFWTSLESYGPRASSRMPVFIASCACVCQKRRAARRRVRRAIVHRAIRRREERYQPCPLPISKSFNCHGLRHRLIGALMIVFFATASSWSTPSPLTPTAPIKTPPPHAPPLPLV